MATVTLHEGATPSEKIVADANAIAIKVDTRGRQIGARRPSKARMVALRKLVPSAQWEKQDVRIESYAAYLCASIDGDPINPPTNELQLDAIIIRLDDDGIRAVYEAIGEAFGAEEGKTASGE